MGEVGPFAPIYRWDPFRFYKSWKFGCILEGLFFADIGKYYGYVGLLYDQNQTLNLCYLYDF